MRRRMRPGSRSEFAQAGTDNFEREARGRESPRGLSTGHRASDSAAAAHVALWNRGGARFKVNHESSTSAGSGLGQYRGVLRRGSRHGKK